MPPSSAPVNGAGEGSDPWVHVPRLTPGRRGIYVTLNGNNHDEYALAGETVSAGRPWR
jgi:hypothetical protein